MIREGSEGQDHERDVQAGSVEEIREALESLLRQSDEEIRARSDSAETVTVSSVDSVSAMPVFPVGFVSESLTGNREGAVSRLESPEGDAQRRPSFRPVAFSSRPRSGPPSRAGYRRSRRSSSGDVPYNIEDSAHHRRRNSKKPEYPQYYGNQFVEDDEARDAEALLALFSEPDQNEEGQGLESLGNSSSLAGRQRAGGGFSFSAPVSRMPSAPQSRGVSNSGSRVSSRNSEGPALLEPLSSLDQVAASQDMGARAADSGGMEVDDFVGENPDSPITITEFQRFSGPQNQHGGDRS